MADLTPEARARAEIEMPDDEPDDLCDAHVQAWRQWQLDPYLDPYQAHVDAWRTWHREVVPARVSHVAYADAVMWGTKSQERAALAAHLRGYIAGHLPAVRTEIAAALLIALEQTGAGEIPHVFTPSPRPRGKKIEGLALKSCIQDAARYVVFCQGAPDFLPIDKSPIATVAREFCVDKNTVRRWKERVSATEVSELLRNASIATIGGKRFAKLRASMLVASAQYAGFGGQAQSALQERGRQ